VAYFEAKMPQIRFWLGLCHTPVRGSLQCSQTPYLDFKGLLLREREGVGKDMGEKRRGEIREGRKWEGMEEGE